MSLLGARTSLLMVETVPDDFNLATFSQHAHVAAVSQTVQFIFKVLCCPYCMYYFEMMGSIPIFVIIKSLCNPLLHLPGRMRERKMSRRDKDLATWHIRLCFIVVMTLSLSHPADQNCENNLLFFSCATVSGAEQGGRSCCAMTHSGEFT